VPGQNINLFRTLNKCLAHSQGYLLQFINLFFTVIEKQAVKEIIVILSQTDGLQVAVINPECVGTFDEIGTNTSVQGVLKYNFFPLNDREFTEGGHSEFYFSLLMVSIINVGIGKWCQFFLQAIQITIAVRKSNKFLEANNIRIF